MTQVLTTNKRMLARGSLSPGLPQKEQAGLGPGTSLGGAGNPGRCAQGRRLSPEGTVLSQAQEAVFAGFSGVTCLL